MTWPCPLHASPCQVQGSVAGLQDGRDVPIGSSDALTRSSAEDWGKIRSLGCVCLSHLGRASGRYAEAHSRPSRVALFAAIPQGACMQLSCILWLQDKPYYEPHGPR